MKKQNNFIIDTALYPRYVMFSINEDFNTLNNRLSKDFNGNYIEKCDHISFKNIIGSCVEFNDGNIVIMLNSNIDKYKFNGVVAHEIFHAASIILDGLGFKLAVFTSCEAYSYLIEYLTKNFYKNYNNGK